MRSSLITTVLAASLFLASCAHRQTGATLTSIQLTDKNGLKQTISHEDRLKGFEQVDFQKPQPYEKVVRSYLDKKTKRDFSKVTTYHPNGHVFQSLDVVGGRAFGAYHEWYPNGQKKIEAVVIEGPGDLSPNSQLNWVFDGVSKAFDEKGRIQAEIYYEKGLLSGQSLYFDPSGQVCHVIPYERGVACGTEIFFDNKGRTIKQRSYKQGKLHGKSLCKNSDLEPNFSEYYEEGRLIEADYMDFDANSIYKVRDGQGQRPLFEGGKLQSLQTITDGKVEGEVKIFDDKGNTMRTYYIKDGEKEGGEWIYYPGSANKPKLYIEWKEGAVCGISRTYYPTGTVKAEREMVDNKKHGLLSAYYEDGSLMLMETYDRDQLVHGKYLKRGELDPISVVESGTGEATFFDETGKKTHTVIYEKGKVVVDSEGPVSKIAS